MAKYKVTAPVSDYEGEIGGARFIEGKYEGELSATALAYFSRRGYKVEQAGGPSKSAQPPAKKQQ